MHFMFTTEIAHLPFCFQLSDLQIPKTSILVYFCLLVFILAKRPIIRGNLLGGWMFWQPMFGPAESKWGVGGINQMH